jgi:hypothetical protein
MRRRLLLSRRQKENHSETPYGLTNRIRIRRSTSRSIPGVVCEFADRHNLPRAGRRCFQSAESVYILRHDHTKIFSATNNHEGSDNLIFQRCWLSFCGREPCHEFFWSVVIGARPDVYVSNQSGQR